MTEEQEKEKKDKENKAKQICDMLLANTLIPADRYATAYLIVLHQL